MESGWCTVNDRYKQYKRMLDDLEGFLREAGYDFDHLEVQDNNTIVFHKPTKTLDEKLAERLRDNGFDHALFPDIKTIYFLREGL